MISRPYDQARAENGRISQHFGSLDWAIGEAYTAATLKALVDELNQEDLLKRIVRGDLWAS